jgi:hypothetical protein
MTMRWIWFVPSKICGFSGLVSLMTVQGSYRPSLGAVGSWLDRALLHRLADATIRSFARQVEAAIVVQSLSPEEGGNEHSSHAASSPAPRHEPRPQVVLAEHAASRTGTICRPNGLSNRD